LIFNLISLKKIRGVIDLEKFIGGRFESGGTAGMLLSLQKFLAARRALSKNFMR